MSQWTLGVRRLVPPPHTCHPTGMDTSTTPSISPALEPETMMALMLRYVEGREEVAHQYAERYWAPSPLTRTSRMPSS